MRVTMYIIAFCDDHVRQQKARMDLDKKPSDESVNLARGHGLCLGTQRGDGELTQRASQPTVT